jgi:hypothetical protein
VHITTGETREVVKGETSVGTLAKRYKRRTRSEAGNTCGARITVEQQEAKQSKGTVRERENWEDEEQSVSISASGGPVEQFRRCDGTVRAACSSRFERYAAS